MFRNGRSQQRIRHIGRGPVIGPIRRLLQAHAGANRLKPAHVVRNRQRPQGDPVRAGGAPRPLRPPSQEIIPDTVLRHLDRDGAVCRLQAIDDHIPVRGGGMGRQVPRRRHRDLPDPAQMQVRRANVRMIQDGLHVRKGINIIGHIYGHLVFTYPSKNDRQAPLSAGDLQFDVFSPDCYSYVMNPSTEQAILAEDVPLCSLETCIKAFKNSCRYSGQTPTRLRFVYVALNDPNDRNGDHLVLVPVWMLESDKGPEWVLGSVGFVNAQTGEWINTEQKDKNGGHRSDAIWFGW